jgi:hypothetical protein
MATHDTASATPTKARLMCEPRIRQTAEALAGSTASPIDRSVTLTARAATPAAIQASAEEILLNLVFWRVEERRRILLVI